MLRASTTWRNRSRSTRSKRMRSFRFREGWLRYIRIVSRMSQYYLRENRSLAGATQTGRAHCSPPSPWARNGKGRARRAGLEERMAETRAPAARPLSPHLQVYRLTLTMVMSGAHRVTGMFLYVGMAIVAW